MFVISVREIIIVFLHQYYVCVYVYLWWISSNLSLFPFIHLCFYVCLFMYTYTLNMTCLLYVYPTYSSIITIISAFIYFLFFKKKCLFTVTIYRCFVCLFQCFSSQRYFLHIVIDLLSKYKKITIFSDFFLL